ncbi:hypothetical protein [Myxococcus sp. AB025B]|uniref:hypothetical protein n=1 Tax=Myxococcus sp. AB025B TaxID=2562794 RepID=UPI0011411FBA|nr:hypothetical protein [Myxococcus sp. AB025B]
MTSLTKSSLYYADDKDIYDFLLNHRREVPFNALLEIARSRGILLSQSDSHEEIASYISSLTFDWPHLSQLYERVQTADRIEKTSSIILTSTVSHSQLTAIIDQTSKKRQLGGNEAYRITQGGNTTTIEVTYSELPDPSKNRLEQRRERKLSISITPQDDGIHVRHDANKRADEIITSITSAIENKTGQPVEKALIELSGIKSPDSRTGFFLTLMRSITDCRLVDVTHVSVDRISEESDDEESTQQSDDSHTPQPTRPRTRRDRKMTGLVRSWLKGNALLQTRHYQDLIKEDFFISHAIWVVEREKGPARQIIFEAEFGNPNAATGFRYHLKGTFEKKRDGQWRTTSSPVSDSDRSEFSGLIEMAARKALQAATSDTTVAIEAFVPPAAAGG